MVLQEASSRARNGILVSCFGIWCPNLLYQYCSQNSATWCYLCDGNVWSGVDSCVLVLLYLLLKLEHVYSPPQVHDPSLQSWDSRTKARINL